MSTDDRERVIQGLFDEMTCSAFAEGNEERIARSLESKADAALLALANEKGTWMPSCSCPWVACPLHGLAYGGTSTGEGFA